VHAAGQLRGTRFGTTVKYIESRIDNVSAAAVAVDLGARRWILGTDIGISMLNLGTRMRFINSSDPLPLTFRVGAARKLGPLLIGADATKSRDNSWQGHVGSELVLGDFLFIRCGYRTGYKDLKEGGSVLRGLTLGGGAKFMAGGTDLFVDYGYSPFGVLTDAHIFSLRADFGTPPIAAVKSKPAPIRRRIMK